MDLSLNKKIVVVSGGARGIGEAIVRAFAVEGSHVYFTYHTSEARAMKLEEELSQLGYAVQALSCDVRDSANIRHICEEIGKENENIDVLVNNAGIRKDGILIRMSEENWDEVLDTNLKAAFLFTKYTLPYMLKKGGSIVQIASVVGETGNAGQANYAASKGGLIALMKSVAKEYGGKNIRCNAVAPGCIDTDMTSTLPETQKEAYREAIPLKRFGTPEETASAVLFLASAQAAYINGQLLSVCGGMHT